MAGTAKWQPPQIAQLSLAQARTLILRAIGNLGDDPQYAAQVAELRSIIAEIEDRMRVNDPA